MGKIDFSVLDVASTNFDLSIFLMLIIPVILVLIFLVIYFVYKSRFSKRKIELQKEPLENFNSADIAFLYKGTLEKRDIISLIIYLADKGYLEIINSDSSYKIRKLKEYDGIDYNEEKLFNELFYSSDEINVADIYKLPYISLRKIKDNITREENIYKVYEKNSFKVKRVIFAISVLLYLFLMFCVFSHNEGENSLLGVLFCAFGLMPCFLSLIIEEEIGKKFCLVVAFFLSLIVFLIFMPKNNNNLALFIVLLSAFLCIALLLLIRKKMSCRTEFGFEIYSKIEGFKKYLESLKKADLEGMFRNDRKMFYSLLPYAYVLGVSKKWFSYDLDFLNDTYLGFELKKLSAFMKLFLENINKTASSGR